jgi:hypothetical protein
MEMRVWQTQRPRLIRLPSVTRTRNK